MGAASGSGDTDRDKTCRNPLHGERWLTVATGTSISSFSIKLRGLGEVEEGKEGINGDGRRPDLG